MENTFLWEVRGRCPAALTVSRPEPVQVWSGSDVTGSCVRANRRQDTSRPGDYPVPVSTPLVLRPEGHRPAALLGRHRISRLR